eukprot:scaffold3499_cov117-Isochrysis_galbana.AAC.20
MSSCKLSALLRHALKGSPILHARCRPRQHIVRNGLWSATSSANPHRRRKGARRQRGRLAEVSIAKTRQPLWRPPWPPDPHTRPRPDANLASGRASSAWRCARFRATRAKGVAGSALGRRECTPWVLGGTAMVGQTRAVIG